MSRQKFQKRHRIEYMIDWVMNTSFPNRLSKIFQKKHIFSKIHFTLFQAYLQ